MASSSTPASHQHQHQHQRREPVEAIGEDLFESLVDAIPFAPHALKVSTVYQVFTSPSPPDRRRLIRRDYRTFKNLLLHLCHENQEKHWGVYVSYDGVLVTRATSEDEAGCAFLRMYDIDAEDAGGSGKGVATATGSAAGTPPVTPSRHKHLPSIPVSDFQPCDYCYPVERCGSSAESFAEVQLRRAAVNSALSPRGAAVADSLLETYLTNFGDALTPPPPPTPAQFAPSPMSARHSSGGGSTFTPQMLVPLLPTYFIPLDDFLSEQMPHGYTAAHIAHIFGETGCIDLVTLPVRHATGTAAATGQGRSFLRLHGGRSHVVFGVTAAAEARERRRSASGRGHGGKSEHTGAADWTALSVHEQFASSFAPDPFLCDAFAAAFAEGPFHWKPLHAIVDVRHTPPHLLRGLGPYGEDAVLPLLYFAQMQHRFQFAADNGGFLCTTRSVDTASLREETTPTPIALAEVVGLLQEKRRVYVGDLEQAPQEQSPTTPHSPDPSLRLSDFTKSHIIAYYGTLRHFLASHADIFHCEDADPAVVGVVRSPSSRELERGEEGGEEGTSGEEPQPCPHRSGFATGKSPREKSFSAFLHSPTLTVELTVSRARYSRNAAGAAGAGVGDEGESSSSPSSPRRTLEEKLEKALLRKDRRAAQKARRQLAVAQNPDSPYTDTQVLLDAVLRYLPVRRPVSLRFFVKSLPPSLADFMPEIPLQFFKAAAPAKVQIFEWRRRNQLYLLRPGLPLPEGKLKEVYSEKELLFLITEELARRSVHHGGVVGGGSGGESLSSLFSKLPYGARMCLGNGSKPFFQFLQQYPQCFLVVFPDAVRMDVRGAKVSLLAPPPIAPEELDEELRSPTWWTQTGQAPTQEEVELWRQHDEAAMRERVAQVEAGEEEGRGAGGYTGSV